MISPRTRSGLLAIALSLCLGGGLLAAFPATAAPGPVASKGSGERATPLPRRDLTMQLLENRENRSSRVFPRTGSIIDNANSGVRPVAAAVGCADSPGPGILQTWKVYATAHFCVHYINSGAGSSTLAQAQLTGNTLENEVYAKEVTAFGYRAPLSDGFGGYDVFLDDIGADGYYGFCMYDALTSKTSAWCGLDNDFLPSQFGAPAINSLRVTAAHEFFHAIQFAYNAGQNHYFMEGTAVWMEDEVYPAINDYLQYLRKSPITSPSTPLDNNDQIWWYGTVVFWKYLSESLHDRNVIKQVWQYADSAYGRDALQSVRAVVKARKLDFARTFAKFEAWNTKPNHSYADRSLFPAPGWGLVKTFRKVGADTGRLQVKLNHLSSSPAYLKPGRALPRTARLRISVDGPNRSTGPKALIQVRMRSGAVRYVFVPLNAAGNGTQTVLFNPRRVRAVVLSPVNANVNGANGKVFVIRIRVVR